MLLSVHHPRYQTFRIHIRALRRRAGLTQLQLAERLEVGQSYVSKVERGERYVDVLMYVDWCRACGAKPGESLDALAEIDGM